MTVTSSPRVCRSAPSMRWRSRRFSSSVRNAIAPTPRRAAAAEAAATAAEPATPTKAATAAAEAADVSATLDGTARSSADPVGEDDLQCNADEGEDEEDQDRRKSSTLSPLHRLIGPLDRQDDGVDPGGDAGGIVALSERRQALVGDAGVGGSVGQVAFAGIADLAAHRALGGCPYP